MQLQPVAALGLAHTDEYFDLAILNLKEGRMIRATRFKRILLVIVSLALSNACTDCRQKNEPSAEPDNGVEESSYGIPVHLYQMNAVIKARPEEVEEFFIDLNRMEKHFGDKGLSWGQISHKRFNKQKMAFGDSHDLTIGMLGLTLPCRMSVIKHDPGKEVWLLFFTRESWAWLLFRIDIRPMADRSEVSIDAIGNARGDLTPLKDQLAQEVVKRIDHWISLVQSEFGPGVDAVRPLQDGMRGELGEELFMAYQASIWINTPPEDVASWLAANSNQFMPELSFGGDCDGLTSFLQMDVGEVKCCPTTYQVAGISGELNTTLTWRKNRPGRTFRVYLQARDAFGLIRFEVEPESGGTRLKCMVTIELPDIGTPMLNEKMVAISTAPGRLKKLVIKVKQGSESAE